MTTPMRCVRMSAPQLSFETVSYKIVFPVWHLTSRRSPCQSHLRTASDHPIAHRLSIAYPPMAQDDSTPLHAPMAITSAV